MSPRPFQASILVAILLALLLPSYAGASAPLMLGFFDSAFTGPDGAVWLQRAAAAGSDVVRFNIGWVAPDTPAPPANFDPSNPADPNYDFTDADAAVREATAAGLRVILDFTGAPQWAEGPGIPADATPGTWRPRSQAIEDYAIALATRYSGDFPDPTDPFRMLPKVWAFQLWNEPNLPEYLEPQWVGQTAQAPIIYRQMLNAFYAGVKSVDPSALVVTAGTAPFGDPGPGGQRIMPALFWRDLLCLQQVGNGLVGTGCKAPAHFDVLAHHPYSVGAPDTQALNADDVSMPDIGKLTVLLRAAERTGGALPHIHHQIWVTETGYNTDPPNPGSVPLAEDRRWLAQALELLWSQGVSLITWDTIVDSAPVPSYSLTTQSGVYFLDGQPKPALAAFSFPLVVWRKGGSEVEVWGRAPTAGRLVLEALHASTWKAVRALNVDTHATFVTQMLHSGPLTLRATVAGQLSLPFSVH